LRIFITYRRDDSAGHAGRLFDTLAEAFGESNILLDVDVLPGADYIESIERIVKSVDVVVVVIGPRWVSTSNVDGVRRLDDPGDFVRFELTTALRNDAPVVVALVGGAELPDAEQLPPEVRDLLERKSLVIHDRDWRSDVQQLIGLVAERARVE
jgi:hypothetical protein